MMKKAKVSQFEMGIKKCIALCCIIIIVVLCLYHFSLQLDPKVSIDGLEVEIQNTELYILGKKDNSYWGINSTEEFVDTFSFSDWELTTKLPEGDPTLSLAFGELWVLELYAEGFAAAYNGYSSLGTKSFAYYNIPSNTTDSVIIYLEKNGTPHELGDGFIGVGTFNR